MAAPSTVTVTFSIHYETEYGQNVKVVGDGVELGEWTVSAAVPLRWTAGKWTGACTLPRGQSFMYKYVVTNPDGSSRWEQGENRSLSTPGYDDRLDTLVVLDQFKSTQDLFTSSAFTKAIFRRDPLPAGDHTGVVSTVPTVAEGDALVSVTLRVYYPSVVHTDTLVAVGSCPQLGNWEPSRAVAMDSSEYPLWSVRFTAASSSFPIEYKFAVRPLGGVTAVGGGGGGGGAGGGGGGSDRIAFTWEAGLNHIVTLDEVDPTTIKASSVVAPVKPASPPVAPMGATKSGAITTDGSANGTAAVTAKKGSKGSKGSKGAKGKGSKQSKKSANSAEAMDGLLGRSVTTDAEDIAGESETAASDPKSKQATATPAETKVEVDGVGSPASTASAASTAVGIMQTSSTINFESKRRWRGAGVAIPVFSLRTAESMGVGEFLDLKPMVDLTAKLGMNLLQLLPINDTINNRDWRDTYPYGAVSVIALHPMYIRLSAIPSLSADLKAKIADATAMLNRDGLKQMDYDAMMNVKLPLLEEAYKVTGKDLFESAEYKRWFADNKSWLEEYALFCFMRDLTKTANPAKWGDMSRVTRKDIEERTSTTSMHYKSIAFWYFVQYHLDAQLSEVTKYAASKRVAFKGDLPIGVNYNSVDAWVYPHLFNLDTQTGAPPDYFAVDGQNWGFPTYNWDEMAKDNYSWWRQRLSQMAKYFQAYRIDHVLGFFRIWSIPKHGVTGILGKFSPALPITRSELLSKGIWDVERLTKPYIREWTLRNVLGEGYEALKDRFFVQRPGGVYEFLEEFNTEQKVKASVEPSLVRPLFTLLENVILLQDGPDSFHPRIEMQSTASWIELDDYTRGQLQPIYINYFYERQDDMWADKAMQKLPALQAASDMLVCAEDLGMVPDCVEGVMGALQILSLEVQRMPKDPKREFGLPYEYPYMSVCTTSSHDTSTLRGWWEEDHSVTSKYYYAVLGLHGSPPRDCSPDIVYRILEQHVHCDSMWAIFPIQDLLGISDEWRAADPTSERINVPANPTHYWRWRLHINLEDLIGPKGDDFADSVRGLLGASGRL